jgi:uncharacterized membrane protein
VNPIITNRLIFIFSLIGFGVAIYITLAHKQVVNLPCGPEGGCETVANDVAAKGLSIPALQAIPTAAFGALMYVAMASLAMVRVAATSKSVVGMAGSLIRLIASMGVVITAWLTYREAFIIHAWCRWCVGSAVILILIFITSMAERFLRPPAETGEA